MKSMIHEIFLSRDFRYLFVKIFNQVVGECWELRKDDDRVLYDAKVLLLINRANPNWQLSVKPPNAAHIGNVSVLG